jgi:pSer/pThr/pTyr-binding forkhead associated (FHA) protein
MPGRLVAHGDGTVHNLVAEISSIGREDDCTVVVACDGVSRRHAEVRWDGQDYVLTDLHSKNGTFLNGARLTSPQPLQHGDVVTLPCQPAVHLTFEVSAATITVDTAQLGSIPSGPPVPRAAPVLDLRIDTRTAQVWARGKLVQLTAKEYQVLAVLHAADGGLVTKHDLAQKAWPEVGGVVGNESIEQMLSRLRRKLEADPERPRHLLTVRGLGYRLQTN